MRDECMYCSAMETCDYDINECDEMLEAVIEDRRKDFYTEWFAYISEYADY